MTRPVVVSKTLAAGSATAIAGSQSPGAAGFLVLTATPVVLTTSRRVIITSGGNDTGVTFLIKGTNIFGGPIQETLAGASGAAAQSLLDYKTITSIYISGAAASTVEAGTNGVASTRWVSMSPSLTPLQASVAVEVTGTVNYTVQWTFQDLNYSPTSLYAYQTDNVIPTAWDDPVVAAATTSEIATQDAPITGARVTINSGTGTIKATFIQAGIAGP